MFEVEDSIQYLNFADGNHADMRIISVISNELENLSQQGFKKIFLEIPSVIQDGINEYQSNFISGGSESLNKEALVQLLRENVDPLVAEPEEFYSAFSHLIHAATLNCITIFSADISDDDVRLQTDYPKIHEKFYSDFIYWDETKISQYMDSLSEVELNSWMDFLDRVHVDRFHADHELKNFIVDNTISPEGKPERAIIIYGALHSLKKNDLDEYLGQDRTKTIAIYSSLHTQNDMEIILKDNGWGEVDQPQETILIEDAKGHLNPSASPCPANEERQQVNSFCGP